MSIFISIYFIIGIVLGIVVIRSPGINKPITDDVKVNPWESKKQQARKKRGKVLLVAILLAILWLPAAIFLAWRNLFSKLMDLIIKIEDE